jgi:hypothetical protein
MGGKLAAARCMEPRFNTLARALAIVRALAIARALAIVKAVARWRRLLLAGLGWLGGAAESGCRLIHRPAKARYLVRAAEDSSHCL